MKYEEYARNEIINPEPEGAIFEYEKPRDKGSFSIRFLKAQYGDADLPPQHENAVLGYFGTDPMEMPKGDEIRKQTASRKATIVGQMRENTEQLDTDLPKMNFGKQNFERTRQQAKLFTQGKTAVAPGEYLPLPLSKPGYMPEHTQPTNFSESNTTRMEKNTPIQQTQSFEGFKAEHNYHNYARNRKIQQHNSNPANADADFHLSRDNFNRGVHIPALQKMRDICRIDFNRKSAITQNPNRSKGIHNRTGMGHTASSHIPIGEYNAATVTTRLAPSDLRSSNITMHNFFGGDTVSMMRRHSQLFEKMPGQSITDMQQHRQANELIPNRSRLTNKSSVIYQSLTPIPEHVTYYNYQRHSAPLPKPHHTNSNDVDFQAPHTLRPAVSRDLPNLSKTEQDFAVRQDMTHETRSYTNKIDAGRRRRKGKLISKEVE